ncbi:MAG: helix-turn-helix transcriptional regulator [Haloferacaceae archaeon]
MADVTDELAFLAQSRNRHEALSALRTTAPLDRYDLEDRLDASRRTVIRTLDALADRGYVTDSDGEYRLTAYGSFLAARFAEFADDVRTVDRLAPFLSHVSADAFDLDPRHLADADVYVADAGSPYALLDRTLQLRREATRIREVAPAVEKKSVEQLARRVRNGDDVDVQVVLPESAAEAATSSPDYREDHLTALRSDDVEMYVVPDSVGTFVGVLDDTVAIATAKAGRPHALVVTTDDAAVAWAEETFARYRDRARPHEE